MLATPVPSPYLFVSLFVFLFVCLLFGSQQRQNGHRGQGQTHKLSSRPPPREPSSAARRAPRPPAPACKCQIVKFPYLSTASLALTPFNPCLTSRCARRPTRAYYRQVRFTQSRAKAWMRMAVAFEIQPSLRKIVWMRNVILYCH